jgi:hypothetical protein
MESEFQEVPIKPVICLFKINFERNSAFFCMRMMYEMDNLLGQDGIISSTSTGDEATLKRVIRSTRNGRKRLTKTFVITLKMTLQRLMGLKFFILWGLLSLHHKKALKFRGTKFLGNRPNLLGIPTFSEELMSWKNSWLQSKYRGNFRGTFVSEEICPRN